MNTVKVIVLSMAMFVYSCITSYIIWLGFHFMTVYVYLGGLSAFWQNAIVGSASAFGIPFCGLIGSVNSYVLKRSKGRYVCMFPYILMLYSNISELRRVYGMCEFKSVFDLFLVAIVITLAYAAAIYFTKNEVK